MAEQNWSLRGEYMESCNCDYLCPCVYTNPQGPATYDNCTALMVFRIAEWARANNGAGDRSPDALRWLYAHDPAALAPAAR